MQAFKKLKNLKQTEDAFFKIRCKTCLMPNTSWAWNDEDGQSCQYCRPSNREAVTFPEDMLNDNGSLTAYELVDIIKAGKKGRRDCLISVTGGRDSSFVLYYAKEILKLNPIAFNFNTGFVTDIAQENMVNITRRLGIDLIQYSIDWRFLKKLARGFFLNYGEVCSVCHQGYFYTVQKVAQWTGLNYVIRGLCKETEANRVNPFYIDWYSLSDEDFNSKVQSFAAAENISEYEIEENNEFMKLREWTNGGVKRIDLPDIIDYDFDQINHVLKKMNWKQGDYYIHADCNFAPILVCCQKLGDGFSKKHLNISNLAIDGVDHALLKPMLLAEENIDFTTIKEVGTFMDLLGIEANQFEQAVLKNWTRH